MDLAESREAWMAVPTSFTNTLIFPQIWVQKVMGIFGFYHTLQGTELSDAYSVQPAAHQREKHSLAMDVCMLFTSVSVDTGLESRMFGQAMHFLSSRVRARRVPCGARRTQTTIGIHVDPVAASAF